MSRSEAWRIAWQCTVWGGVLGFLFLSVMLTVPSVAFRSGSASSTVAAFDAQRLIPISLSAAIGVLPMPLGAAAGALLSLVAIGVRAWYPKAAAMQGGRLAAPALAFLAFVLAAYLSHSLLWRTAFSPAFYGPGSEFERSMPYPRQLLTLPVEVALLSAAIASAFVLLRVTRIPLWGSFPQRHVGWVLPTWTAVCAGAAGWYLTPHILAVATSGR